MFPSGGPFFKKFRTLLGAGVDAIQIRLKKDVCPSFFGGLRRAAARAEKQGVLFIVNDRPELALALRASGVHLGKSDVSASVARKLLGKRSVIGRTIRNSSDLSSAESPDYDYAAIGPVFRTPLKPTLKSIPSAAIRKVVKISKKPVVAIGGITDKNAEKIVRAGIRTVAFARYAVSERNTAEKIKKLRAVIARREGGIKK